MSGSNILLTCVVRDLGNHTLLWKYGVSKVLTAGTVRITSDSRYSVLHDKGKFLRSLEQFSLVSGEFSARQAQREVVKMKNLDFSYWV